MTADLEIFREYCLAKAGVTEGMPFGDTVLVFKVMNKIFSLLSLPESHTINLKCDPERAIELREEWEEIQPGYHMNKKHWNTIQLNGRLQPKQIFELIDHSYELVVQSLKKREREELELL